MIVTATEVKNNFGTYLEIAQRERVSISKNGRIVAMLVGAEHHKKFLADTLVGIIPQDVHEESLKDQRRSSI
jgi:prevent-host-death family protein